LAQPIEFYSWFKLPEVCNPKLVLSQTLNVVMQMSDLVILVLDETGALFGKEQDANNAEETGENGIAVEKERET
jgi:hypothetical protein